MSTFISATPSFQANLPAYSSLFLGSSRDLEGSDKIILPDCILRDLVARFGSRPMPTPLIFEIQNVVVGRVSHCGVLEFTATDNAVFMPSWMMENLLLSEGANVRLKLHSLPKLTFVKFQPLKYSFTQIDNPKALLENSLHKFTALTQTDTIMIRHHDEDFLLNVVAIEPTTSGQPPAACCVDTNVNVEFDAPLEEAPKEEPISEINLDEEQSGDVAADSCVYYRLKLVDPNMGVKISIKSGAKDSRLGKPDIYVSCKEARPSPTQCLWKGKEGSDVVVDPSDKDFCSTWYYIAVHSFGLPAKYVISAEQVEPRNDAKRGSSLGRVMSPVAADDSSSDLCDNCLRRIPHSAFRMHSIMCARNNWTCPECRQVIPRRSKDKHVHCEICHEVVEPDEMEKHRALFHRKVECKCGMFIDAVSLPTHKASECSLRKQSCKFCGQKIPAIHLDEHQSTCGSRTQPCDRCGKNVPRKRMDIHMATEHGVNPCLDASGNRLTQSTEAAASDFAAPFSFPTSTTLPSTEDEMLAAALAASQAQMRRPEEQPLDEDEQLARAIFESQRMAEQSNLPESLPSDHNFPSDIAAASGFAPLNDSVSISTPIVHIDDDDHNDEALQAAISASLGDSQAASAVAAAAGNDFDSQMAAAIAASLVETEQMDLEDDSWD